MTRELDMTSRASLDEPDPATDTTTIRRWWQRPWVIPLAVVVVAFLAYVWPPYLSLDPAQSLVPLREGTPAHYPMVVLHILFGSIALLTLCVQLWPVIRRRYPAVHRWSGRLYVFGGALPSGLLAMVITPLASAPTIGTTLGGILWLITTVMGYIRARQRRFRSHRQWMLYSFAFAINIVWGRVIFVVLMALDISSEAVFAQVGSTAPWLGWVINLFLVQWWLNRTAGRPLRQLV